MILSLSPARASRRAMLALVIVACAIVAGPVPARAVLQADSCTDPYWRFSLRCALFPTEPPQPNYGSKPTTPDDVKAYTRVFLERDRSIRSVDGTLPVIYVDRAVCTQPAGCSGVPFGQPIESNRWLFSMTGGGSCYVDDSTIPGVYDDPTYCLNAYTQGGEAGEMGTAFNPPMKNLFGIHDPDPDNNPLFASFNRIRIEKSSYDRYQGRATFQAPGGAFHVPTPAGGTLDFNLYQHGFDFILETIRLLETGIQYKTWVTRGGRIKQLIERLPPLTNASQVLFVGHSGAAHGLYHNIDRFADRLGYTDVRAMFDANFEPGVLNEAAFGTNPMTGSPLGGDAYTNQWSGKSSAQGVPFFYHGRDFYENGVTSEQHDAWDSPLDQSCLAVHAGGNEWGCNDRIHVLMNHIETPFFLRQDWSDGNPEHTMGGQGYSVYWGDEIGYPWCPTGTACPPIMTLAEREVRLAKQAATLITDADTRSELGANLDPSLGGAFPTFYVWMPDCASHNGAYENTQYYGVAIDSGGTLVSLRQYLQSFMAAPALNTVDYRVVGFQEPGGGSVMTQAPCP